MNAIQKSDERVINFEIPHILDGHPCLRLWLAVLAQAKADLMSDLPGLKIHNHNKECSADCQKLKYTQSHCARESAIKWFEDDSEKPQSFRWVCSLVNIDPDSALTVIFDQYEQAEKLRAERRKQLRPTPKGRSIVSA